MTITLLSHSSGHRLFRQILKSVDGVRSDAGSDRYAVVLATCSGTLHRLALVLCVHSQHTVRGVAQWLGRRPVGLSLTCASAMVSR